MNNANIIVEEASRRGIDRCNCSKCKGCAGTARVCFNSRKLASRAAGNALAKAVGLLLLLSCFFLQGNVTACDTTPEANPTHPGQNNKSSVSHAQKDNSPIDPDYYQSTDNPFHAD
jgi:hypothetical protein